MTSDSAPHRELNDIYHGRQMDAVAARWDNKAARWDRDLADPACHLNEDDAYQRFLGQLALVVQQRHDFCRTRGVIDAGCATGLVLASILPSFAWGIGVDISPRMIRVARAKQLPKSRFLIADCFKLCDYCPKAGAIVSRGVLLSHYGSKEGESLLQSAHSCLVEGGFIFWDFLNQAAVARYGHIAANKAHFEAKEICALATRAGFGASTILGEPDRRVRMLYAER